MTEERKIFSLSQVSKSIQKTLNERYQSSFLVQAEMIKLNYYMHSGHCYPDLVEKKDGKVIAQMRSMLWKMDYYRINRRFHEILNMPLQDGIKILMEVKINFDSNYGLALQILDIDPTYTLGDLEREKTECIQLLKSENLFNKNRQIAWPFVPKRIAIISVESSKGYADFLQIIENNAFGYSFEHQLFPSLLQGDKAVKAIQNQLFEIEKVQNDFDVVAIIRGGGGDVGLTCFNNFELSKSICEFPLPVITGIGHATNETVVELVANHNAITPSKLAEFLIQKMHEKGLLFQENLNDLLTFSRARIALENHKLLQHANILKTSTSHLLHYQHQHLSAFSANLLSFSNYIIRNQKQELNRIGELLQIKTKNALTKEARQLEYLEKQLEALHPKNVLKRGYSIARIGGKSISKIGDVRSGDVIETEVLDGKIASVVK